MPESSPKPISATEPAAIPATTATVPSMHSHPRLTHASRFASRARRIHSPSRGGSDAGCWTGCTGSSSATRHSLGAGRGDSRRLPRETGAFAGPSSSGDTPPAMADAVDIDVTREMRAPAAALWAVLDDLSRLPEWLEFASALEESSGDRATAGTTYTVKPGGRFEPKTHWRIAEADPPRRQLHTSEMPMLSGVTSEIEVLDAADGGPARVHVHWRGQPSNLFGRMMRGMFQKRIQENWERSLEKLDELASAAPAA